MSTTLTWTENYGTATHPVRERLSAIGFSTALLLLAAGAAGLFSLQASFGDAVTSALRSL